MNEEINFPHYIVKYKNHLEFKNYFLPALETLKSGKTRFDGSNDLKNYFLDNKDYQPYIDFILQDLQAIINATLGKKFTLWKENCWFVKYEKYKHQSWHNHGLAEWAGVYYLDLDSKSPGTQFQFNDNRIFTPNVNEGDVLLFSGKVKHRSPPNLTNKKKTVIVFDLYN